MKSGKEFDDGVKTVNFLSEKQETNTDVYFEEPDATDQDRWQSNWNSKKNKERSLEVTERIMGKRR